MKTISHKRLLQNILFIWVFTVMPFTLLGVNAPVTTVKNTCNAVAGQPVTVPITVTGFTGIGSFYLYLEYDYSKIQYSSVTKNPLLTGNFNINDLDLGGGIHRIILSWSGGIYGKTLADGSSIVDFVFNFISGPAELQWNTSSDNFCAYTDAAVNRLNDSPKSSFYINGVVSATSTVTPTITPGGPTTFCEGGSVTLTSSEAVSYLWSNGETTRSIEVFGSGNYSVTVTTSGGCTTTSDATAVLVYTPSTAPTSITGTTTICSGLTTVLTASGGTPGTDCTYEWGTGSVVGTNIISGANTVSYTTPALTSNTTYWVRRTDPAPCSKVTGGVTTTVVIRNDWTGAQDVYWNNANNWCGGIPTSSTDAFIPQSAPNMPYIGPAIEANCKDLTLEGTATLTIESNATLSGSLIVNGTASGTGVTYRRHLSGNRWYILSPPVSGQNILGFLTNGLNQIPFSSPDYSVTDYDEPNNDWSSYFTSSTPGTFHSGKGYLTRRTGNGTVSFTGSLQTSAVTSPVTYSKWGWNAVGNPYTSAIGIRSGAGSTDCFLTLTTNTAILEDEYAAIYVWNEDAGYSGFEDYYKVISNSPATNNPYGYSVISGDDYVPPGQGFLVNVNNAGSITFTPDMRYHANGSLLKSADNSWKSFTLVASYKGKLLGTGIGYHPEMTPGLDKGYDAGLLESGGEFELFTRLASGNSSTGYAIQSLPSSALEQIAIPVGLDVPAGGEITFSVVNNKMSNVYPPIIEDRLLKKETVLATTGDNYKTTVPPGTYGIGRFYLKAGTATPANQLEKPALTAHYVNEQIVIYGSPASKSRASLIDMLGRKLGDILLQNENRNVIPAPGLVSGVYLLHITGGDALQVIKVPVVKY